MNPAKTILSLFFLLNAWHVYAQQPGADRDFSTVDSISKTIKYRNDIYGLTKELTSAYNIDQLKVRAIFIWMADNIEYDYQFVNKDKEIKYPECESGENCEQVRQDWEKAYFNKVLKKKKAICDGYARVFKKMCEIAGIKCEIVGGYTKTKPYQVGMPDSLSHAWNTVYIDSAWHFLDVTWAAGGCGEDEETGKLLAFHKRYDNYYWFTSFHDLARNHYPKEAKWVMEANYTKDKFANNPYYAPDILSKIQLLSPASGVIQAKKGDTIHFSFDYTGNIQKLQINSNVFRNPQTWYYTDKRHKIPATDPQALKMQQYIPFTQHGNRYEFTYVVTDNSLYYIDILFNYKRTLRFNVKTGS